MPHVSDQPLCVYEISTREGEAGRLTSHRSHDGSEARTGRLCHEQIFARSIRCTHCPVLGAPADGARRAGVVGTTPEGRFVIALGRASGDRAEVEIHHFGAELLPQLMAAKAEVAAAKAGLSKREREVLDLLVLGRTSSEVAAALGISQRTAKYHQSNILTKLGAESRLDLWRLFR